MVDAISFRERHFFVATVNTGTRGINQVPHLILTTALQHVQKAREVAVGIGMRMRHRVPDASLRRQIESQIHNSHVTIGLSTGATAAAGIAIATGSRRPTARRGGR